MKLEDLAYAVAQQVFHELEHTHHYVVPESIQRAVLARVREQLGSLIKK
jgi:hypothetical protein